MRRTGYEPIHSDQPIAVTRPNLGDLYPYEPHYLDLDGVRMHYVDEGTGPVVLLLHGNPTWSFYYRRLISGLRDRYRVIAPDHIGCGLSDKPRRYRYSLAHHIANLERLTESLRISHLAMAVHDWGGAIGFGWARRHPAKLRAVTVFNTAAFLGPCPWRIRACAFPVLGGLLVRGLNAFARGAVHMACRKRERMTVDVKRGYLWPYRRIADRIGVHGFVRDIPYHSGSLSYRLICDIDASLALWKNTPMMICWGGKDFCFHDWYLQQWRARFPAASVHRFADAGHYVVEDAHEEILPLMSAFLAAHHSRQVVVNGK